ncbi:Conjugative relaxase domain protein [Thiomonas sp. CB3]|nr:Conjugative relaxase domain protein [Thiomonas sp. CB3]
MISKSAITNASGAAGYYSNEQAAAEYYSGEAVPSAWRGKGAQMLGLQGKVSNDALTAALEGRVTDATGARALGRKTKDGQTQHRAGWDFTISAPKSVSIQALVHGDQRAANAHRAAAAAALDYLEKHGAQFRPDKHTTKRGAGLVAATFEHVSSRAGDPQLHTHALIANVTLDPASGKAYSLSNENLFHHRRAADAIYHATLAHQLQKEGIAVRFDREGRAEIDSYTSADLKEFSTRAQEIEDALAQRGQTRESASAQTRDMLALATRHDKTLPETREAHAAKWQAQADALGLKPAEAQSAIALQARQEKPADAARDAVEQAKEHLTEREYIFQSHELHQQAARFSQGRCDWKAIEKEIAQQEQSGGLVRQGDRYTTAAALAAEKSTVDMARAGLGDHESVMNAKQFDRALESFEARKGFALSDEQRAASKQILCGDDRFQAVQGLAGTGKTTMLEFVREAAESRGWTVLGHSNGSEQAAKMQQESGIQTSTTAKHLIEERQAAEGRQTGPIVTPHVRELRIMDEASQAGQREVNEVLKTTREAGARTVFLGDSKQHQSVEAGRAFERLQPHVPTATLGEASIRRQRTDDMKAAVRDVLAGRHDQALQRIQVKEVREAQAALKPDAARQEKRDAAKQDNAAVIKQIAKDYTSQTPEQRSKTLIVTATNDDRKAINSAIREELKSSGQLGQGAQVTTLRKADLSAAEAKQANNYQSGQALQVGTKTPALERGATLNIERVDSRTNTLHCIDQSGGRHAIDPAHTRVQAYFSESRELAAGDRLRFTENHKLPDGTAVRNGQSAAVEKIDGDRLHLRIGEGDKAQRVDIDRTKPMKVEHAYASTSHSAQGQTVDKVMIHHNTEGGRHGDRENYVNLTRARDGATLYTQDSEKASRQAGAALNKTSAHDLKSDGLTRLISPAPESKQAEAPKPERTLVRERTRDSGMTH